MSREIITKKDIEKLQNPSIAEGSLANAPDVPLLKEDDYTERLIKYIPTEIVTLYLFLSGILVVTDQTPASTIDTLKWIVFVILLILTFVYQRIVLKVEKIPQVLLGTVSFAVWVFAIGGPFVQLAWYRPIYGSVLLPLYTFAIALYRPEK